VAGVKRPVTLTDILDGHAVLDIQCLDRIYLNFILSFCVTRRCDLRRLVKDSVLDEMAAA
jgi:hypothetical protein